MKGDDSVLSLFDPRQKLIPSHSFLVTIGPAVFSFSKVQNLEAKIEYDAVPEGGNNDYPHLFKKQKTSPDTLILEKGVRTRSSDAIFNLLQEGMQVELVTIMLMKDGVDLEKVFFFKKGLIVRRSFSNLDAMQNELLIESLEIAHSGLVEVPIPGI